MRDPQLRCTQLCERSPRDDVCNPNPDGSVGYALIHSNKTTSFRATYRPISDVFLATRGPLDAFLVERYCLYTQTRSGTLARMEVHHSPWPLRHAAAEVDATSLLATHGLTVDNVPPMLHFSEGIDVVTWLGVPV